MEGKSDSDMGTPERVCKDIEIKQNDLYGQSDALLLADVFNNFWNICLEIYGLDPVHFHSTPGLGW